MNEAFAQALAAGGRMQWQPAQSDFVLDMAPTWDEFRRRLKRNIRESLRHCYNSLRRDSHGSSCRSSKTRWNCSAAWSGFSSCTGCAPTSPAALHPNRFASKVSRDFLYEVCTRLCERRALRLFRSKSAEIVAMRIGFVAGERSICTTRATTRNGLDTAS